MANLDWQVPEPELADLRARLAANRWPAAWPVPAWDAGTDLAELRRLVGYWADGFDWRGQERAINDLPRRHVDIDGVPTHFLRFDGERDDAVPLLVTNGWPSTLFENGRSGTEVVDTVPLRASSPDSR